MYRDRKKIKKSLSITESILREKKVALFILTYNAENQIRKTIERIPESIRGKFAEIFVIDDSSIDRTLEEVLWVRKDLAISNLRIFKTPYNQGYGGNQKIGYTYALRRNFDYVIMLHGDGQYPPEKLSRIIDKFKNTPDAVFGSRMMNKMQALKGGMPVYKWIGNQILTSVENAILGTSLTEFHSGYRSYSVALLKDVPFLENSDDFHFDTDIVIQLTSLKKKVEEIQMPTYYGGEVCHVNGMWYAWNCIWSCIKYRLHVARVLYRPKYDVQIDARVLRDFSNAFEEVYSQTVNSEEAVEMGLYK